MTLQTKAYSSISVTTLMHYTKLVASKAHPCMGPCGAYFLLTRGQEGMRLSKRGAEVARDLVIPDRLGRKIVDRILLSAEDAVRDAGDGGTTTIVMACDLIAQCAHYCESSGTKPLEIATALADLEKFALSSLDALSRPLVKYKDVIALATTAANGDRELGNLIGKAQRLAKKKGEIEITGDTQSEDKVQTKENAVVITLGASSHVACRERVSRANNALAAVHSALLSGTVPGSGLALFRAAASIKKLDLSGTIQAKAAEILADACKAPLRQVLRNASKDTPNNMDRIASQNGSIGFDVVSDRYGDLRFLGILDSTEMASAALKNAVRTAAAIMRMVSAEIDEDKPA